MRTLGAALILPCLAALAWAPAAAAEPDPARDKAPAAGDSAPVSVAANGDSAPVSVAAAGDSAAVSVAATPVLSLRAMAPPGVDAPAGADLSWAIPRGNVASVGPIFPVPLRPGFGYSSSGSPLRTGGIVVMGLGALTLFGAGATAIVAAASTAGLDDDCPNKVCIEGSQGARSLSRARDAALAADWLIGIGTPMMGSGLIMVLYSAVVDRYSRSNVPAPVFFAGPTGGSLRFHF